MESNNDTETFNNDENLNIIYKKKDKYKTPFIIMACLFGASLIPIAFLSISLLNLRKNKSDIKTLSENSKFPKV